MSDKYKPSRAEVRSHYRSPFDAAYDGAEFDRWLESHDADLREQIARDIEERMDHDDAQRVGDAFSEGLWSGLNEARHIARGGRS